MATLKDHEKLQQIDNYRDISYQEQQNLENNKNQQYKESIFKNNVIITYIQANSEEKLRNQLRTTTKQYSQLVVLKQEGEIQLGKEETHLTEQQKQQNLQQFQDKSIEDKEYLYQQIDQKEDLSQLNNQQYQDIKSNKFSKKMLSSRDEQESKLYSVQSPQNEESNIFRKEFIKTSNENGFKQEEMKLNSLQHIEDINQQIQYKKKASKKFEFNPQIGSLETLKLLDEFETQRISSIFDRLSQLPTKVGLAPSSDQNLSPKIQLQHLYYVQKENNSQLISHLLQKLRSNWQEETDPSNKNIVFKWHQNLRGIQFNLYSGQNKQTKVVNHFEFQNQLTDKCLLYNNLKQFCQDQNIDIFKIMPYQVNIDFESQQISTQLFEIVSILRQQQMENVPNDKIINKLSNWELEKVKINYKFPIHSNKWIVKISHMDTLKGVWLINNFEDLFIMNNYRFSKNDSISEIKVDETGHIQKKDYFCYLKSSQFVIQNYIKDPFLIDEQKIQISAIILMTQNQDAFVCNELIVRFSQESIEDNQTPLISSQLSEPFPLNFFKDQIEKTISLEELSLQIQEKCLIICKSVLKKINQNKREICFDIFEFEFVPNSLGECYLVEVNSNLKYGYQNKFTETLYPLMLNDVFALTLDQVYPPRIQSQSSKIWKLLI